MVSVAPEHEPRSIAERFVHAWNDADADALADLFAEDADFVNVVGLWWNTREDIRTAHEYGFRKIFGDSTMELEHTSVRAIGAEAAVVIARWRLTGQRAAVPEDPAAAGSGTPGPRRGVITFVVQKGDDGAWQAVAAQNTDRIRGAETHVADDDGALRPASYQRAPG